MQTDSILAKNVLWKSKKAMFRILIIKISWSWSALPVMMKLRPYPIKDCCVTITITINQFHEIFPPGTTRQRDVKDLWFITNSFRVTMNLLSWSRWYLSLPLSLYLYRLPFSLHNRRSPPLQVYGVTGKYSNTTWNPPSCVSTTPVRFISRFWVCQFEHHSRHSQW